MSKTYLENVLPHYWKSYNAFMENFHQRSAVYDIGDKAFLNKVVQLLPKRESLRILGIGSGQGKGDCLNKRRMLNRVSHVENVVVEPSIDAMEVYKSLLSQSKDLSRQVSTTWYQETFQEYQKRRERSGARDKFHFIGVVQSLYYADKDGSSIGYLIDLLEEDGVLFIAIMNDQSGEVNLYEKVTESFGPDHDNPSAGYVTSQVVKLLDNDGRVSYDIVKNHNTIDISACFEADSSEGSLMLDFLTHVVDFKNTVSQDSLNLFLGHLKSPDCSDILTDGRIIFRDDWDAVIIRKKQALAASI